MHKMKSEIELNVIQEAAEWTEAVDFDVFKVAEELKNLVFLYVAEHTESELLAMKKRFVVNVALGNDEEVHKLNKEFRGIDKPTNVLSFASVDDDEFWETLETEDELELGNIIVAFEMLKKEAELKGISVYAHFCHLLVHGFLHILGFDHQTDDEAEEMEALEIDLLEQFSIENPYREAEEA